MDVKAIAVATALHGSIAAPMAAQSAQGPATTAGSDLPTGAIDIVSPDGTAHIAIWTDGTSVAVWRNGERIVAPSPVDLDLRGAGHSAQALIGIERDRRSLSPQQKPASRAIVTIAPRSPSSRPPTPVVR